MKWILMLAGLASFLGGLMLMYTGSSLFADFRTENVAGPGVDVFVLDKYPEDVLPLEIIVRGGSKTGLAGVFIYRDGSIVSQAHGEGVTWGDRISSKGRGADNTEIEIPVKSVMNENGISFDIQANYVCAMSSGSGYFDNEQKSELVHIELPADKRRKLAGIMLSLFYLAMWALFWYLVILLIENLSDGNPGTEKELGYSLLGFLITGGIIGYWIFARPLAAVFGITGGGIVFLFMLLWFGAIVMVGYPMRKRLKSKGII